MPTEDIGNGLIIDARTREKGTKYHMFTLILKEIKIISGGACQFLFPDMSSMGR